MPRAVHPSIIKFYRRKMILPSFEHTLEGCDELIQVSKELYDLHERHFEHRRRYGGRRESVLTLLSLCSLW